MEHQDLYKWPLVLSWKRRSRNKYTLIPLFYDERLDLEQPMLVADIPDGFYWQNSEGYAFDVRSVAALLGTNFRNLNPLTINDADRRPLWCSQDDLASLIMHTGMPVKVKDLVKKRITQIREIPKHVVAKLARLANELYSFDMQGFYDWVAADTVLPINKEQILQQIANLQKTKREHAIRCIEHCVVAQANEHAVEPFGVNSESELYTLMETYKAVQVSNFIDYVENLRQQEQNLSMTIQSRLDAYKEKNMMDLLERYTPTTPKDEMLWHMSFCGLRQRMVIRNRVRREINLVAVNLHVRMFYKSSGEYTVVWNNVSCRLPDAHAAAVFLHETVPAFLRQQQCLRITVKFASIAGGLTKHRGKNTKTNFYKRIEKDNAFLWMLANEWALSTPFVNLLRNTVDWTEFSSVSSLRYRLLQRLPWIKETNPFHNNRIVFSTYMSYNHVVDYFVNAFESFLSYNAISKLIITGGYDMIGATPLMAKLHGSLAQTTCIQDVAAELCEMLSIPYAPEDADVFAKLQCDHTNIPPLLKVANV
jgi:hypothetical protein